jgi:hypothetical protein
MWNEMIRLLREEAKFNNIYLRVEDVKEVKLLIGGTRMQRFHKDVQLKKQFENNVTLQKYVRERCASMLLSCTIGAPVKLACLALDHTDEEWDLIKQNFRNRKSKSKTRAMVRHAGEKCAPYDVFECSGIVFSGDVKHAGMPVRNCDMPSRKGGTAIKQLKNQRANKNQHINLESLKKIKGLSEICRVFVATWPEEELGDETRWTEPDTVSEVVGLSSDSESGESDSERSESGESSSDSDDN